jgi:hypothetical protein
MLEVPRSGIGAAPAEGWKPYLANAHASPSSPPQSGQGLAKLRSDRVKAAVQRNAEAGRRTGGGSRPFGYKINYQDLDEGSKRSVASLARSWNRLRPRPSARLSARVLRRESAQRRVRRGIQPAGGKRNGEGKIDKWQGATLRRVLLSHRIAGLGEHNGDVVGRAVWPEIIDEPTHDRLVGLLKDPSRRLSTMADLVCTRWLVWSTADQAADGSSTTSSRGRGRGYGCRKDENPGCEARVRIVAEPVR